MRKYIDNSQKGSFTVELTILFTFILFVLFAFVFGIMCAYQNMFLQKAVNSAVLEATETQDFSGVISDDEEGLKKKIDAALKYEMQQSIFGQSYEEPAVIQGKQGGKIVEIEVKQYVDIPMGGIKQFFTGSDKLVFTAKTNAVVDNTVQVMRNTDLCIEMANRFAGDLKKLGNALTDGRKLQAK